MTRLLHIRRARDAAAGAGRTPPIGADRDEAGEEGARGAHSGGGTEAGNEGDAERGEHDRTAEQGAHDRTAERDAEKDRTAEKDGPAERDAGDGGDDRAAGPDADSEARRPDRRRPWRSRLSRTVPAACAAALVLGGCGFFWAAHQARSTPSAENHALTDTAASTRVAGDVGNALARVFSYTPDGVEATERSARAVLGGRAARQYAELMDRVRADLAEQRVTLSTQAVRTGVIELDGDRARLLVFLDQISHRGKDGTTSAAAQLTVTARWEEDQWRIVDIRTH